MTNEERWTVQQFAKYRLGRRSNAVNPVRCNQTLGETDPRSHSMLSMDHEQTRRVDLNGPPVA